MATLDDICDGNVLASFDGLQRKYELPQTTFYRYLQLRHVIQTQFGTQDTDFSGYPLIGVLRSQGPKGLISSLYLHLLLAMTSGA